MVTWSLQVHYFLIAYERHVVWQQNYSQATHTRMMSIGICPAYSDLALWNHCLLES